MIDVGSLEKVGTVLVDSGQLMIIDPCYIPPDFDDDFSSTKEESYGNICSKTLNDPGFGEVMGGWVTGTYWGDGSYSVYANLDSKGNIKGFYVDMYGQEDEECDCSDHSLYDHCPCCDRY